MISFKQKISRQVIEDVIVTALEGGSNYWYFLRDEAIDIIKKNTPEMNGEPLALRIVEALSKGVVFSVEDIETGDHLGYLSTKLISKHTEKLYADGHGDRLEAHVLEQADATDADIVFQYWVMGELVFG